MKIGIITLYGLYNYGNRLQNLAVTELLQRKGCKSETIVCEKFRIRACLKSIYFFVCRWIIPAKRKRNFESFNKKYISINHFYRNDYCIPSSISDSYDAFITGSDQVWNPEYKRKGFSNYFLRFAPPSKRFCLSPSIGVTRVSCQYESQMKFYLDEINLLSCRELSGAEEIKRLTGKHCDVLIDPTLALDASYWRKVGDYTKVVEDKYVLCVFLGQIPENVMNSIIEFSKVNGYKLINLLSPKDSFYVEGPEYFISLIDKAELIFTDSFHAVAFSINLNTPFYVFDRKLGRQFSEMNSRIQTVINMFGMQDRYVTNIIPEYSICHDYAIQNKVLQIKRAEFDAYLNKVLIMIKQKQ